MSQRVIVTMLMMVVVDIESAAAPCDCVDLPFVPGYNLGGEGFDITTMKRKTSRIIDMDSDLRADGKCWTVYNKHMNMAQQKIPAAVTSWKAISDCSRSITTDTFDSAQDFTTKVQDTLTKGWKLGLSAEVTTPKVGGEGSFSVTGSNSRLGSFTRTTAKTMQSEFIRHETQCGLYEYTLPFYDAPLSYDFLSSVHQLPNTYKGNELAFKRFLHNFGTHYFHKVKIGGRFQVITAVNKCQIKQMNMDKDDIANCMKFEASAKINAALKLVSGGVSGSYDRCKKKLKDTTGDESFFGKFNTRKVDVLGGEIDDISQLLLNMDSVNQPAETFANWINGLKRYPEVIGYDLRPLFDALDFVPCNKTPNMELKKTALHQALEAYLFEARNTAEKGMCSNTCQFKCPGGYKPDNQCKCKCQGDASRDQNCCPIKAGLGSLKINNVRGDNLGYYDKVSWMLHDDKAEPYVLVEPLPQNKHVLEHTQGMYRLKMKSHENYPRWTETLDFGTSVRPGKAHAITLTLKDADAGFYLEDDKILHCDYVPRYVGGTEHIECNDGRQGDQSYLRFDAHFTCNGGYVGQKCNELKQVSTPVLGTCNHDNSTYAFTPKPAQYPMKCSALRSVQASEDLCDVSKPKPSKDEYKEKLSDNQGTGPSTKTGISGEHLDKASDKGATPLTRPAVININPKKLLHEAMTKSLSKAKAEFCKNVFFKLILKSYDECKPSENTGK